MSSVKKSKQAIPQAPFSLLRFFGSWALIYSLSSTLFLLFSFLLLDPTKRAILVTFPFFFAFLLISIAVVGDEELADFLLERFKERTPGVVEQHIEEISGTTQAECKLISTFADIEYSLDSIWSGVVKFAVIGGVIFMHAVPAANEWIGCGIMLVAIIIAQLPPDLLKKKA